MEIVVLDGGVGNPGDLSWEELGKLGELRVYDQTPEEKILERIGRAEVVITNKTPITDRVLEECPTIRYVAALSTGYNVIDVDAARRRGIPVSNVPAYGTDTVAQFAIALLLEICNRVAHHSQTVFEGRWSRSKDFCYWDYPMIELAGKTMGIIGFGRIGKQVGRIARAMGMRVLACGSRPTEEGRQIGEYVDMDTLLAASDVISLHCPLFPETEGLINRRTIAKMKDGAILLNNSRGQLLVEEDVAEALNSGKLYAAGVDVVSREPILPDNPLLKAKNCFITPHISWAAREARQRIMDITVKNVKSYQEGSPINRVDGAENRI